MIDTQNILLSLLTNDQLIERLNVSSKTSIEEILEGRDTEKFSALWMAAYKLIESEKKNMEQVQCDLSTQIREAAYLRTFARWKSPDLAAYISDDFGLIADASALAIFEPWIEGLLRQYKVGEIPHVG